MFRVILAGMITQILHTFKNKRILIGVTGSIAAYKSAELIRRLKEQGAIVRVMMTSHAKQFITPLTLQAISGLPVHEDLFDLEAEAAMGHIELARWAELILIAPASANTLATLLHGRANDLLSAVCLATRAPIWVAPAMNQAMWENAITQQNVNLLQKNGIHFLGPDQGSQACGETGYGRMLEPVEILKEINHFFQVPLLAHLKIIVTAGPTREAIDPIRYLSNESSGKMGFALAKAAVAAGARVTLISGPVHLNPPPGTHYLRVKSAHDMRNAVFAELPECDIFLGVAAVADYRVQHIASQKIHKTGEHMTLILERNPDIIAEIGKMPVRPFIVGFAAETEHVTLSAKKKRLSKNMDMIIANEVGKEIGMNSDYNAVTVITAQEEIELTVDTKQNLARQLIPIIAKSFYQSKQTPLTLQQKKENL